VSYVVSEANDSPSTSSGGYVAYSKPAGHKLNQVLAVFEPGDCRTDGEAIRQALVLLEGDEFYLYRDDRLVHYQPVVRTGKRESGHTRTRRNTFKERPPYGR
jgi:hypothetical protein